MHYCFKTFAIHRRTGKGSCDKWLSLPSPWFGDFGTEETTHVTMTVGRGSNTKTYLISPSTRFHRIFLEQAEYIIAALVLSEVSLLICSISSKEGFSVSKQLSHELHVVGEELPDAFRFSRIYPRIRSSRLLSLQDPPVAGRDRSKIISLSTGRKVLIPEAEAMDKNMNCPAAFLIRANCLQIVLLSITVRLWFLWQHLLPLPKQK